MAIKFQTVKFEAATFIKEKGRKVLFVFAIGYEERSRFIFNQLRGLGLMDGLTPVSFIFDDYVPDDEANVVLRYLSDRGLSPKKVNYDDYQEVVMAVRRAVNAEAEEDIDVHVDYSSMPRSWYCRLPELANSDQLESFYFWYSVGDYSPHNGGFPSAGVRDIRLFSGRATLRPINNRTHIFGLGFDHVRTQGIMSVLDPSYYGVCYAFCSSDVTIQERIRTENQELINSSAISFELPLQDFEFMISKLCDLANNLVDKGDVIFLPDGPKPLIFACSLVPTVVEKKGVLCLHINRHDHYYEPIDVKPRGEILGFVCYDASEDY